MPYKKRYYKKRKYNRSFRPKSSWKQVGDVATKALSVALGVKKLLNVEFKQINRSLTNSSVSNAGLITNLTNMLENDTNQTRTGGSIKLKSIQISAIFTRHPVATATFIRVMLIQDNQTNQALYNVNDVLFDSSGTDNIVSARNINNNRRFRVLYDDVISLADNSIYVYKKYRKLDVPITYDSNVGDITDLSQKSMSLLLLGSESSNLPDVTFHVRLRYIDN